MSSDDAARLMAGVLAAPADDGARRVLADYLGERGDPRGELINLQCERLVVPIDEPRRIEIEAREGALVEAHARAWADELGLAPTTTYCLRRGFIDFIDLPPGELAERVPWLAARTPLRHVAVKIEPGSVPPDDWSWLARIDTLDLYAEQDRPDAAPWLEAALASGHAAGLRGLLVTGLRIGDGLAARLAAAPALAGLRTLALRDAALGVAGVDALAASPHLAGVRILDLTENPFGDAGAAALAAAPGLPAVDTLCLPECGLGTPAVHALAGAPLLSRLRVLSLGGLSFDRMPCRPSRVDPGYMSGFLEGVFYDEHLIHGYSFAELPPNTIDAAGAAALAAAPAARGLEELSFSRNPIGDEGVRALLGSRHLAGLRSLYLRGCDLHEAPAAAGPAFLDLLGNALPAGGIAALFAFPTACRWVSEISIEAKVCAAPGAMDALLEAVPRLPRLQLLEIVAPDAAILERLLAAVPDALRELWLIGSAIGDAGVRAVCAATHLGRLRKLALGKIGATPAAVDLILQAPHLRQLEKLFVTWSEVGEAGFGRLSQTYGGDVVEGWG